MVVVVGKREREKGKRKRGRGSLAEIAEPLSVVFSPCFLSGCCFGEREKEREGRVFFVLWVTFYFSASQMKGWQLGVHVTRLPYALVLPVWVVCCTSY